MLGFGQDKWLLQVKTNCGPCRFLFFHLQVSGQLFFVSSTVLTRAQLRLPRPLRLQAENVRGRFCVKHIKQQMKTQKWMQVGLSCYVHCVVYNNKSVCDTQSFGKSLNLFIFSLCHRGRLYLCSGRFTLLYWLHWKPLTVFCHRSGAGNKNVCVFNIVWVTFLCNFIFLPCPLNATI